MGLSLKQEDMVNYLEQAKAQAESLIGAEAPRETFYHMLWGTVIADLPVIEGRTAASVVMAFLPAPGVGGAMPNNAFCYIGMTEGTLYVIALDAWDTSKIIGTFEVPFSTITSLKMRKGLGSQTIEIQAGGFISLTVKGTSVGTNIKDQKERMAGFISGMEHWKSYIPG
jgi:hypothetical protein